MIIIARSNSLYNLFIKKEVNMKIKRFFFASSIYVFSRYGGAYKNSKQQCEINIKKSNVKSTIIRFGSIYGPGSSDGNTIYDLLKMAIQKKQIIFVIVILIYLKHLKMIHI